MLGIAAERIFLLLCDSLAGALSNANEKTAFGKLLDRFPMKPKLDWVHSKVQQVQKQAPAGFPENATIMLVAIYDLMRCQRNELGHPREAPPNIERKGKRIPRQQSGVGKFRQPASPVWKDFTTANSARQFHIRLTACIQREQLFCDRTVSEPHLLVPLGSTCRARAGSPDCCKC